MAYANFDLKGAVQKFDLTTNEGSDIFAEVEDIPPNDYLLAWLDEFAPVALGINTEQARREYIIAPILGEAKRRSRVVVNVFPGVILTVDEAQGLTGVCDYLIARSPELYYIKVPIIAVVEAKKEDITAGLGQCAAEMVAIQLFNEREGTALPEVYGCVTSGNLWRFLSLKEKELTIDSTEYYLRDLPKLLGILVSIAGDGPSPVETR